MTNALQLYGDAYAKARENGVTDIRLSLSHSDSSAIAVALAIKGDGDSSY